MRVARFRRRSRWARAAVLAAAGAALTVGCSSGGDGTDDPLEDPLGPVPTTTRPPADESGDFFTWQQRAVVTGQPQQVATTRRAWDYYNELSQRYGGYDDPAWAKIASPEFAEGLNKAGGTDILVRGDVRYLLFSVKVGAQDASTVICLDNSDVEQRRWDASTWTPSPEPEVVVSADHYRRAASSPTGWISAGPSATDVTREQCAEALARDPAVSITGTDGLPGR